VDRANLLAFSVQSHHVPRDVNADGSAKGMLVKDNRSVNLNLLNVAVQIARMTGMDATAITWELADEILIRDRKAVSLLDC
jgi:hypothetical protein